MNASVHLLEQVLPSVVHVRARIPEQHPSARILGIDYPNVTQAGLIPTGYLKEGVRFKPGPRDPVAPIVHWDTW